jgi:hypothetical protein
MEFVDQVASVFLITIHLDKTQSRTCWGPSAYEGPQKQDLTVFLEYNV